VADEFKERFPEGVEARGERRHTARMEPAMRRAILECLRSGPKTIPEVARALGLETHEATWWIQGYVRYGFVRATEEVTDDGYYRYAVVEGK
jgi:hypothetical protein